MAISIIGRIRSVLEELPNSERKIAEFILQHPDEAIEMTTAQLGEAAHSNSPAVIRLCSRIGINGFTQLKVALSGEIAPDNKVEYADVQPDEPIESIKSKLLGNAYKSMEETLSLIGEHTLATVTRTLQKAPVVYVYGIGASHLVAENIAQKWNRIGKLAICPTDAHALLTAIPSAPKGSVFFAVSNSGETKEIIKLAELAKEQQLKTIALTQFGNNSLMKAVDLVLQTVKPYEAQVRSAATSSLHAQFAAVDLLFFAYTSKEFRATEEKVHRSRKLINEYKNRI